MALSIRFPEADLKVALEAFVGMGQAAEHAAGEWRHALPRAKELRLHPGLMEACEVQTWVASLTPTIQQAGEELEEVLGA